MTRRFPRVLAAAGLAMTMPWAVAVDCGKDDFKQARTMAELPAAIRERVIQRGAVANPGERWIDTDVVDKDDKGLPGRALAVAAVGQHHAFVALWIGGGPWLSEGWRFERGDGEWRGGRVGSDDLPGRGQGSPFGAPATLPQLLYAACDGYPRPFEGNPDAVSGVVTSKGSVVLTVNDETGSVTYRLDRGHRDIRLLQSTRPLSAFASVALRDRLVRARDAMSPTDGTYPLVTEYLKALDADAPGRPSR